jgi:hypothetical protein
VALSVRSYYAAEKTLRGHSAIGLQLLGAAGIGTLEAAGAVLIAAERRRILVRPSRGPIGRSQTSGVGTHAGKDDEL